MPASWLSQYSLRNGGSVPSFWVTSYCIGVSFFFSSSSDGLVKFCDCDVIDPPLDPFDVGSSGADCDCAQARERMIETSRKNRDLRNTALPPLNLEPAFRGRIFDAGGDAVVTCVAAATTHQYRRLRQSRSSSKRRG